MRNIIPLSLLLCLAACGSQERPENNTELPEPSGPPIVQQVEPEEEKPAVAAPAESGWTATGGGLQLIDAGKTALTIRCTNGKLVVHAPSFTPIGSEDRFAFGLGDEPVTMVADPTRQPGPGVTAETPVPDNLESLWRNAGQMRALYGTQQVGPIAAPPPALADPFLQSCR